MCTQANANNEGEAIAEAPFRRTEFATSSGYLSLYPKGVSAESAASLGSGKFFGRALEQGPDEIVLHVIGRLASRVVGNGRIGTGCKEQPKDPDSFPALSGGARSACWDNRAMEGRGTGSSAGLIRVRSVLEQCLNGDRVPKADGVVKRGDTVLIGGMDVGPGMEQGDDPLSLVGGIGVLLGADPRQFKDFAHALVHPERELYGPSSMRVVEASSGVPSV